MLRGMTGYGRAVVVHERGSLVAEAQSVNKRHLAVDIVVPREFSRFEGEIRKRVTSRVSRGEVTVKVSARLETGALGRVQPNLPLVRQWRDAWLAIYEELGWPVSQGVDPALFASLEGLFYVDQEEGDLERLGDCLMQAVDQAMNALESVRDQEGAVLSLDLKKRAVWLRECLERIRYKATEAVPAFRRRLEEKIKEYAAACADNEERILREVCLYADRVDIAEEMVRFQMHLDHFDKVLEGEKSSSGKTLEFLCQELGREINTVASKAADGVISGLVVEAKGELERIREQIQNVE